jgi:hypothetical protein
MRWVAGVEATFLWPQLNRDFLNVGFDNSLGSTFYQNTAALGSIDGGLLVGPRLTLGLQGECWGLIGRYWNASGWETTFVPTFPDAVDSGVLLFDNFQAYTADLEVQRRFCWRNWDMIGSFGVRYAGASNDRSMALANTFGTDLITGSAFAAQQFFGTGLTFGLYGIRPLFCDDGAAKVYVANRYSVMFGNGAAVVQTSASAENTIAAASSIDGALAESDGELFIAEIATGLQWDACLKCLPGRAYLRWGLEWQYWDSNAGVEAGSFSFADVITSASAAETVAGDLLFDLIGFHIGAGITY